MKASIEYKLLPIRGQIKMVVLSCVTKTESCKYELQSQFTCRISSRWKSDLHLLMIFGSCMTWKFYSDEVADIVLKNLH